MEHTKRLITHISTKIHTWTYGRVDNVTRIGDIRVWLFLQPCLSGCQPCEAQASSQSCFFLPLFPVVNFALTPVCTQFHHLFYGHPLLFYANPPLPPVHSLLLLCTISVHSKLLSSHLITPFPLPRSIPLRLFWRHNLIFFTVSCFKATGCRPVAQPPELEGQSTVFKPLEQGGPATPPGTGYPF
jgi:hypothetical protein